MLVWVCVCVLVLVCVCVSVCVVWCGVCRVVWHAENPRVPIQNASVCTFKTSPCMPATRRTCFSTCARGTHGDVLNVHTESVLSLHTAVIASSAYQNLPTLNCHVLQRFTESNHWMLPMFKFENRSRTTFSRFLQSFSLPDKAVKLQLLWGNAGWNQP